MPVGRPSFECNSPSPAVRKLFDEADQQGLKAYYVALKLGVTPSTLSHWRSGRTTPSMDQCETFAELLKGSGQYVWYPNERLDW